MNNNNTNNSHWSIQTVIMAANRYWLYTSGSASGSNSPSMSNSSPYVRHGTLLHPHSPLPPHPIKNADFRWGGGEVWNKKILMPNIETSNRVLNVERQFIMPYTTYINTIMSTILATLRLESFVLIKLSLSFLSTIVSLFDLV